jgi:hypothetical protein
MEHYLRRETERRIESIVETSLFIKDLSPSLWSFYRGEILKYQSYGAIGSKSGVGSDLSLRVRVIDLASVDTPEARILIADTLLQKEWQSARRRWEAALDKKKDDDTRVPTFIVVDEAHNLIPLEPRRPEERIVRDRFRTVAAEGRKFGMFLLLVSQRPDKLDPMVVSECENRAVMKLSGQNVLATTVKALGLEEVPEKQMQQCLEFRQGRMLLYGPWTGHAPTLAYGAARRTEEGGRSLRKEFWAKSSSSGARPGAKKQPVKPARKEVRKTGK